MSNAVAGNSSISDGEGFEVLGDDVVRWVAPGAGRLCRGGELAEIEVLFRCGGRGFGG